jgi:hypothetical protein
MSYKYGDTIRLKDGVMPQLSLDAETFFNLPDEEDDNVVECNNGNGGKIKTYWGLPESAFETDMGYVYLKSEYAKRFVWGVDAVIGIHDDFGGCEYDRLNINVAFDPEGVVNSGAFCSFVNECDIVTEECDNITKDLEKDIGAVIEQKGDSDMTGMNKRVVHKEFGAGEIDRIGLFGNRHVVFVRFDGSSSESKPVLKGDLMPEEAIVYRRAENLVPKQKEDKGRDGIDDTERKLAHEKEMDRIQSDRLAELNEIENMSNEILVDEFELLIRNGAGHGYRRIVFMKREMIRRMDRGDHL